MNNGRSSLLGWGSFAVAVGAGMVAANFWRSERESTQVRVRVWAVVHAIGRRAWWL
jgi:hypothetical protein